MSSQWISDIFFDCTLQWSVIFFLQLRVHLIYSCKCSQTMFVIWAVLQIHKINLWSEINVLLRDSCTCAFSLDLEEARHCEQHCWKWWGDCMTKNKTSSLSQWWALHHGCHSGDEEQKREFSRHFSLAADFVSVLSACGCELSSFENYSLSSMG